MWFSATSGSNLKGLRNPVFMLVCGVSRGLLITVIASAVILVIQWFVGNVIIERWLVD